MPHDNLEGITRIKQASLRVNDHLLLSVPGKGVIPLTVTGRDYRFYLYDELRVMSSDEYIPTAELSIAAVNALNALEVRTPQTVYQVFYDIAPSNIHVYLGYPTSVGRGNLEVQQVGVKSRFGAFNGFQSPRGEPNPETELWIPYGMRPGFALWNHSAYSETPTLGFYIWRYRTKLNQDPDSVHRILNGAPGAIRTLGGVEATDYSPLSGYDLPDYIPQNANRSEISAQLNPQSRGQSYGRRDQGRGRS